MKTHLRTQGLVLGCLLASTAAFAQVGSLSETLATQTEKGGIKLSFSATSFDKNDASVYGNLGFVYGFSDQFNFMVRASGAGRKDVGVIETGGSDVEFQLVFRRNNFYASVGASLLRLRQETMRQELIRLVSLAKIMAREYSLV